MVPPILRLHLFRMRHQEIGGRRGEPQEANRGGEHVFPPQRVPGARVLTHTRQGYARQLGVGRLGQGAPEQLGTEGHSSGK